MQPPSEKPLKEEESKQAAIAAPEIRIRDSSMTDITEQVKTKTLSKSDFLEKNFSKPVQIHFTAFSLHMESLFSGDQAQIR